MFGCSDTLISTHDDVFVLGLYPSVKGGLSKQDKCSVSVEVSETRISTQQQCACITTLTGPMLYSLSFSPETSERGKDSLSVKVFRNPRMASAVCLYKYCPGQCSSLCHSRWI